MSYTHKQSRRVQTAQRSISMMILLNSVRLFNRRIGLKLYLSRADYHGLIEGSYLSKSRVNLCRDPPRFSLPQSKLVSFQ